MDLDTAKLSVKFVGSALIILGTGIKIRSFWYCLGNGAVWAGTDWLYGTFTGGLGTTSSLKTQ